MTAVPCAGTLCMSCRHPDAVLSRVGLDGPPQFFLTTHSDTVPFTRGQTVTLLPAPQFTLVLMFALASDIVLLYGPYGMFCAHVVSL